MKNLRRILRRDLPGRILLSRKIITIKQKRKQHERNAIALSQMSVPKLPPVSSASPRPVQDVRGAGEKDDEEIKSNHTSEVEEINPSLIGLSAQQKRELLLAAPPRRKQNQGQIRKDPPDPNSILGKAFACYNKYHDKYMEAMNKFDAEFTQLAREDAAEAARIAALQVDPPSTVASPRIDATLEDVIDLCKSHVNRGKAQRLRKLVRDNMIDVNQQSKMYGGWTPLIAAARMGSTRTMKILVEELNADVNVCDIHHWSPLMYAAYRGHVHTVRYLVEVCQADRTIKCKGRGWTAQMYARQRAFPKKKKAVASEHHQEIVSILRGDTPHQTPRVLDYDAELTFKSLLFNQHKQAKIEQEKIAAVLCWCVNLETRCKKCQYKITNKTNAEMDEERALFLKREEDEEKRRRMFEMAPGVSDDSDSDTDTDSD